MRRPMGMMRFDPSKPNASRTVQKNSGKPSHAGDGAGALWSEITIVGIASAARDWMSALETPSAPASRARIATSASKSAADISALRGSLSNSARIVASSSLDCAKAASGSAHPTTIETTASTKDEERDMPNFR